MKIKNRKILVALVGNQNSGKTSIFNKLVGANQKVGNWPGVTVEKTEGHFKYKEYEIVMIDLPGIYSLSPYTPEEQITRDFIQKNKPDVILNVVDATNLYRNFYLTMQLLEMQKPMLVALNIFDEVKATGISIDVPALAKLINIELVPVSTKKNQGLNLLLEKIVRTAQGNLPEYKIEHYADLEDKLQLIIKLICQDEQLSKQYSPCWLGIKLLEGDRTVYKIFHDRPIWLKLEPLVAKAIVTLEKHFEQDLQTTFIESRYAFIRGALRETVSALPLLKKSITERIDDFMINRIIGLPMFLFLMWLIFQTTFSLGNYPMGWLEQGFSMLRAFFMAVLPAGAIRSLLVEGIISGVGGVIIFVPNILILFMGISILEATGYLSRAAFVVDRAMHKIGLHGRSFIPLILGFGCSVPAFMACRTLKNRSDRLTTMLILPFMSCSAKLPVYVLLLGAFFPKALAGNILFGIYLFGMLVGVLMSLLLKTLLFKGESEPFVMELPPYRLPSVRSILIHTWEKASMYLRKAGTVILFFAVLIWFLSNYPVNTCYDQQCQTDIQLVKLDRSLSDRQKITKISLLSQERAAKQLTYSYAGRLGRLLEPAIRPLGFNWKIGIALVSGFAAKEVIVSTLSTIYSIAGANGQADQSQLSAQLKNSPDFSPLIALSLMIFVLLYVPCMAATAVFHQEVNSWKWTWFYIFYTTGTAYFFSLIVYQGGRFLGF